MRKEITFLAQIKKAGYKVTADLERSVEIVLSTNEPIVGRLEELSPRGAVVVAIVADPEG